MTAETSRTTALRKILSSVSASAAEELCLQLSEELERDLTAARERVAELEEGLRTLIRAYVSTLEIGRDRIVMLGGQCDSLEQMEREDPHLRAARALLAPEPKP